MCGNPGLSPAGLFFFPAVFCPYCFFLSFCAVLIFYPAVLSPCRFSVGAIFCLVSFPAGLFLRPSCFPLRAVLRPGCFSLGVVSCPCYFPPGVVSLPCCFSLGAVSCSCYFLPGVVSLPGCFFLGAVSCSCYFRHASFSCRSWYSVRAVILPAGVGVVVGGFRCRAALFLEFHRQTAYRPQRPHRQYLAKWDPHAVPPVGHDAAPSAP